jgi:hypothetical protein
VAAFLIHPGLVLSVIAPLSGSSLPSTTGWSPEGNHDARGTPRGGGMADLAGCRDPVMGVRLGSPIAGGAP